MTMNEKRQDPCKVCEKKESCKSICEKKTDWFRRAEEWLDSLTYDGLPKCDYHTVKKGPC